MVFLKVDPVVIALVDPGFPREGFEKD